MKVVFLDIDGVLVPFRNDFQVCFPDDVMASFRKLIDKINPKIVLSSDWRIRDLDKKLVNEVLNSYGIKSYDDVTPYLGNKGVKDFGFVPDSMLFKIAQANFYELCRVNEIFAWLDNKDIENFVIFDDMHLMNAITSCLPITNNIFNKLNNKIIRTSPILGLTDMDIEKACLILE